MVKSSTEPLFMPNPWHYQTESDMEEFDESILASVNVTELRRGPAFDWANRHIQRQHVAELFHENSKIARSRSVNVAMSTSIKEKIVDWYTQTCYHPEPQDLNEDEACRLGMIRGLEELAEESQLPLTIYNRQETAIMAYGLDLFLIHDRKSYRIIPGSSHAWSERKLRPASIEKLKRSLIPSLEESVNSLLVVAGVPWRYMQIQGPRGYRRMLIDVGYNLSILQAASTMSLRIDMDFYDREIDRALAFDGVDRSVMMVATRDASMLA